MWYHVEFHKVIMIFHYNFLILGLNWDRKLKNEENIFAQKASHIYLLKKNPFCHTCIFEAEIFRFIRKNTPQLKNFCISHF